MVTAKIFISPAVWFPAGEAMAFVAPWAVATAFCVLLVIIGCYGLHRWTQVLRFAFAQRGLVTPDDHHVKVHAEHDEVVSAASMPFITIQIPVYNEGILVERVLGAVSQLDWPLSRLEVQLLDDSDESESLEHAARACRIAQTRGVQVHRLQRLKRNGYKAGALAFGLESARGEFIAVFDADFVPPRDFLRQMMPSFAAEERIGLVQAAWSHLNADENILTACQALSLDGHFAVEQTARAASGCWFNFNGTAGIWRRCAIVEAGGWSHETLTEDADLSYRAQLLGWRFIYRPDVKCPAALPPTMTGLLSQQHRWNKGLLQTAMKLLPQIMRANVAVRIRLEALMHLTSPVMYPVMLVFAILAGPGVLITLPLETVSAHWWWMLVAAVLFSGIGAASAYCLASQWMPRTGRWLRLGRAAILLPTLFALGVGMSVMNTGAALSALQRRSSAFIRTPKTPDAVRQAGLRRDHRSWRHTGGIELFMGVMMLGVCATALLRPDTLIGTPFLLLFALGFLWVGAARWKAA